MNPHLQPSFSIATYTLLVGLVFLSFGGSWQRLTDISSAMLEGQIASPQPLKLI